jgi:hypothetical protein
MLATIQEANELIRRGACLMIAGSRECLAALQPGNWIGGSIPYFMTDAGGLCDRAKVYVDEVRLPVTGWTIKTYTAATLRTIAVDAYANGFSYIIIPGNSQAHLEYALHAPEYPEIFLKPVIGWIAGVHLADLQKAAPVVFDGRTATCLAEGAVVLHVKLPAEYEPMVYTVNLFRPGTGPTIQFPQAGFDATDATVDDRKVNFATYLRDGRFDASLPLVADYAGTDVNVSIKAIDEAAGKVSFYAPVFPGVDYHLAAPVANYAAAFAGQVPRHARPLLSCNCILNYVFGELDGKLTAPFVGPFTFGEIAHQLVNQTLVYLACEDVAGERSS